MDRPVSSLAENVQKAMAAFYDVHRALMLALVHQGTSRNPVMVQFKQRKEAFRRECESLRQVLEHCYHHAADYASSCQRAPSDRYIAFKRCNESAKSILREVQGISKGYTDSLETFASQRSSINGVLNSGRRNDPVSSLYTTLADIQVCLADILAFWQDHVTNLALVAHKQSNFPSTGDETKATVELWKRYQSSLMQSRSSISESADAMVVDPSMPSMGLTLQLSAPADNRRPVPTDPPPARRSSDPKQEKPKSHRGVFGFIKILRNLFR
ncbi:hypothetical protein B0H34DRAFT_799742 [Crassisporium funariophilum]|nr:hypothetical protein B0H34DRAFT_799742 [Crassisporium funariophilum]